MIKKKEKLKKERIKTEKARTWHLDPSVVSHAAYDWDQAMRGAHPREMEDFESYTRKIYL